MTGASDGRRRRHTGRSRRAAVLAPVLLSLLAPPAVLRADAVAPPRLAGTTTFLATTNATITVRVPRAASLVFDANAQSPNIDLSANAGRLAGFALTAVQRPDRNAPTLVAMQTGLCSQRGCRPTAPYKTFEYVTVYPGLPTRRLSPTTQQVTLPAGDYIVRAVTDGAPVRMTLRLAGLSGATTVRLSTAHPVVLRTDASTSSVVGGVDPLRNVGVTHEFGSDLGLMMDVVLTEYEPHVRNETGVCLYLRGAKPVTGRYHPGCPGAEASHKVQAGQPTLHYYGASYVSDIGLAPGPWTRGYYTTGVGGASSLVVVSLWMDLI